VHAVADVHETPFRLLPAPTLGVARTLQRVPSQRSASVTGVPVLSVLFPTAVHAVAEVHDTPDRLLACAPMGLGVVWIVQDVPSQPSASVTTVPALLL
jgi:hypothetical protein